MAAMSEDSKLSLSDLSPAAGARGGRKRIGRGPGSGSGKTAGRGHKGQKARSGGTIPAWFEGGQMPLYRRVPKRGFKPLRRVEYQIVNVWQLAELEETEVSPEVLRRRGLVGSLRRPVKVLGNGELERSLVVRAHAFSGTARQKIEAAGGSVVVIAFPSGDESGD
jgi:large subunit ribosomal protein L15